MLIVVPFSFFLFFIEKKPKCSLIIFVTIGKPNPLPVFFVVKYGVIAFFASDIPGPLSSNLQTI